VGKERKTNRKSLKKKNEATPTEKTGKIRLRKGQKKQTISDKEIQGETSWSGEKLEMSLMSADLTYTSQGKEYCYEEVVARGESESLGGPPTRKNNGKTQRRKTSDGKDGTELTCAGKLAKEKKEEKGSMQKQKRKKRRDPEKKDQQGVWGSRESRTAYQEGKRPKGNGQSGGCRKKENRV